MIFMLAPFIGKRIGALNKGFASSWQPFFDNILDGSAVFTRPVLGKLQIRGICTVVCRNFQTRRDPDGASESD
jgi:hypothetical protein